MSTETKSVKSKRFKGSVLFTTLVVMILILLIMLSAIGLAGMASKRAYSTWYDNQTKYTAQDLVDNVVRSLAPGQPNETLGGTIIAGLGSKGSHVDVSVAVSGSDRIPGYGQVSPIRFEYVANNGSDYTIPGLTGHDNERIIKVSASVTMGGETSTYSTYVVGNALTGKADGNGGGYIAMSDLKGGSGSNDAPGTIGRFYAGIDDKIDKTAGGNNTLNGGDIFINTDEYKFNSKNENPAGIVVGRNDPENGYYGGMRVTGDLIIENGLYIQSQYPPAYLNDLSSEKFFNIPYLYVDGAIKTDGFGIQLKEFNRGGSNTMGLLNIYCDHIEAAPGKDLVRLTNGNSNVMIMGEGKTNTFKFEDSLLTDWASQTISGVSSKGSIESGNFYCKGSLNNTGKKLVVNGDFCVVGDLNVGGGIEVHNGDAYIGGTVSDPTKVTVDTGYTVKAELGAGGSSGTFVQKVRDLDSTAYPHAADTATRFETAFKIKADGANGKNYVQTLDNIKTQFKDSSDPGNIKYVGVVEASNYTGTDVWDGSSVITKSCIWDSSCNLGSGSSQTIRINPADQEIWINIDPSVTAISTKTIIVDDSLGGSVKFFIEKGSAGQSLALKQTKIVTQKYYDMLYGGVALVPLSAYPDKQYVPQIYMYAASDNDVKISMSDGNYMYTGDIIAPKATFQALSTNGVKKTVNYTYFNYLDMDGDGVVSPSEQANPVNINKEMDLCFVGSLEVGQIDVTNLFGYIYVDDPPKNDGGKALSEGFSWTTIDGYSTY